MTSLLDTWNSEPYRKIRENPRCKPENILFLCYGGSIAYGTNVPESDTDIRGVLLEDPVDIMSNNSFNTVECNETDTQLYSLNKFISLLSSSSPAVIEMIGCLSNHYYVPECNKQLAYMILGNTQLFMSKQLANSFGGYASAQLRRLKNALSSENITDEQRGKFLLESVENAWKSKGGIAERHQMDTDYLRFWVKDDELCTNVKSTLPSTWVSTKRLNSIMSEISNIEKTYLDRNHRNSKKDALHLNKHAMHLVRLYYTGLEILLDKRIHTFRSNEHDILMSIRYGRYMLPNEQYDPAFFELVDSLEEKFKKAVEVSRLPSKLDMNAIKKLTYDMNLISLKRSIL